MKEPETGSGRGRLLQFRCQRDRVRVLVRAAAILVGHFVAAQAVGFSIWAWPDFVVLGLPSGVVLAFFGFPYLILELPTAAVIYWVFDCCRTAFTRVLIVIVSPTLGSAIGYGIAPRVGESGRLHHGGYVAAGSVFTITILIAAFVTRPKLLSRLDGSNMRDVHGTRPPISGP
jgi:hypothetical protein